MYQKGKFLYQYRKTNKFNRKYKENTEIYIIGQEKNNSNTGSFLAVTNKLLTWERRIKGTHLTYRNPVHPMKQEKKIKI